jgi:hypothetical protein
MERLEPVKRLKRVDLPTFGRPTMAISGSPELSLSARARTSVFFAVFANRLS